MPRDLIQEETPRDIAKSRGLSSSEQVHKRFIRYKDISELSVIAPVVALGAPKAITPGTITSTTGVSGSVQALRKVSPGTITSTTTTAGTVSKAGSGTTKAITPGTITSTTTVRGSIVVPHPVTPVLDNFNRANGDPGPNWNGPAIHTSKLTIQTNRITAASSQFSNECWVANRFGPVAGTNQPIEVFAHAVTQAAPGHSNCLVMFDDPTAPLANGFVLVCSNTNMAIYRCDSAGSALLTSLSTSLPSGVYLWMRYLTDGTVEGWSSTDNITWTRQVSVVETAHLNRTFYIGLQQDDQTVFMDDFGGGGVVAPPGVLQGTINSVSTVSGTVGGPKPISPPPTAIDTFTRADGGLGANWTATSDGGLVIASNRVKGNNPSGDTNSFWNANTFADNQFSQIKNMVQNLGSDYAGVTVRQQGTGGQAYYLALYLWGSGSPTIQLYKHAVGGGYIQIGSSFSAAAAGPSDTLRLEASGSTLTVKWNGTAVITQTDTTIPSGGAPGIQIYQSATADDWSGGTLAATYVAVTSVTTVSGAVTKTSGAAKAITPGTITSTTTVGGAVQALRKITPGTITSTTTVAGATQALRAIKPATIVSTTTVAGSVKPLRRVAPGTITSTTTVAGTVQALRKITPGTITSTTTVAGTVTRLPAGKFISGSIASVTTVAGAVQALKQIKPGTIVSTTTVAGSIKALRKIAPGTIASTTTVAGTVTRLPAGKFVSGTITSVTTVAGSVQALHRVTPGTITSVSAVAGAVQRLPAGKFVAGTVTSTTTVTGSISRARRITPTAIVSVTTVNGSIKALRRVTVGTIASVTVVSGSLVIRRRIVVGSISSATTVNGRIVVTHKIFVGTISSITTVTGAIRIAQIAGVTWRTGEIVYGKTGRISKGGTGRVVLA
jgi:hypothetical protein